MRTRALVIAACTVAVVAATIAGVPSTAGGATSAPATASVAAGVPPVVDLTGATTATWAVTPGVELVTITGAPALTPLTLLDDADHPLVTLTTDELGQLVISYVPAEYVAHDPNTQGVLPAVEGTTLLPGTYRVVDLNESPAVVTDPFEVLDVHDVPDPALYDGQTITASEAGDFQYIEVRDGVTLSAVVHLPPAALYGTGPFPTLVEYNGYSPSRPGPPEQVRQIANLMGYATVGVNLRGTGCSGGTFDVFSAAQAADGYDVIEAVARQPWVKGGEVGMIGISYGGITQLYVAPTHPPHLAAITPLSVIEDPWYQQWPGGNYNSGFTQEWLAARDASSEPGGSGWVADQIAGGDTECDANAGLSSLRHQNIDFEQFGASLVHRPTYADSRRLSELVDEIDVPVFLTGAWQDEQTGQRFATLLDDFTSAPVKRFTMFNGRHPDGLTPLVMDRWVEFLELYVDDEIPTVHPLVKAGAPAVFEDVFGVPGLPVGEERFLDQPSAQAARDAYEAEPDVRVLFESGANPDFVDDYPAAPQERWERSFDAWPPAMAEARTLYLGPDGTLVDDAPATRSIDRYEFDADVGQTSYANSSAGAFIKTLIDADWKATEAGKGLAYLTEPLAEPMVIGGDGYVDLWFRSTGTDAPIEIVLSEVYEDPDPNDEVPPEEVIVQHGLLRAAYSHPDEARSTPFLKEHRFESAHYDPLEPGQFVHLQVPVYAIAHPFRAGSRIRLEVNTPGGDTPLWEFVNEDFGATTHDVARGGAMPSALVLPVLPAGQEVGQIPAQFEAQADHPPCNSLRGQVCRSFTELVNDTVHEEPACDAGRFSDVGPGGFCSDVTWLSDEGITEGYGDGTFRPTTPISRQAMAAFLYRLAGEPEGADPACASAPFPDVPTTADLCGEVQWLVDEGIASGYGDGTFRPEAPVSRQATAAFLHRVAGEPAGSPPSCSSAPFPDVGAGAELCGEIAWLASTGITEGYGDGTFRPGAPLSRQAMAAFLHRFHVWGL